MMKKIRTFTELSKMKTFEERFEYLKLSNGVGIETFGFDRYLNQSFYSSPEWRRLRNDIIIRDNGCDLGVDGYEISRYQRLIIHHMNPITIEDIIDRKPDVMDPEYLICASFRTHNAIHYSDESILLTKTIERKPGDTCPWKRRDFHD